MEITPPSGIALDLDSETYHADPCATPSLSSSVAHILTKQSPKHAWAAHPRLGGKPRAPRAAWDTGSLSHRLLLGAGDEVAIVNASDWRTKAAKEARAEARARHAIPVLRHKHEEAQAKAEIIRAQLLELGFDLTKGHSEVTAFWRETWEPGKQIECRARLDHLIIGDGRAVILDLKSTASANPSDVARSASSFGYHIQETAYRCAIETIRPDLTGRVDFAFLFYELEEPYAVTPARLSGSFRELGSRQWARAVQQWGSCLERNAWPGYTESVVTLEPPPWALKDDLEAQSEAAEKALFGDDEDEDDEEGDD
jgi:PDDEXK-like domain of unknown function (DUF3799)